VKPADGIKGPGIGGPTISLSLPDCVQLKTPEDDRAFKAFVDAVVSAAKRDALLGLEAWMIEYRKRLSP
jgi:hypothetical protein